MTNPLAFIVEDYEDDALVFAKAFEMAGYVTEIILDGAIAEKRLSEAVPAVVLLDLHLPNVSGRALLRQIRADERLAETRVFLATADAQLADELREDADLVLVKPIRFAQLGTLAIRFRPPT